jgi:uncharacterized protein (DUF952 family)
LSVFLKSLLNIYQKLLIKHGKDRTASFFITLHIKILDHVQVKMSTNSAPTPPPKYIYKILPSLPVPPSPLPISLPVSALDARDNFIHLSTSFQILGTLNAFFSSEPHVYILRIPYERVEKWIKWEDAKGKGPEEVGGCWDTEGRKGLFPHVHGNGLKLGREEVDEVGTWNRKEGREWSVDEWPFGEGRPGGA